MKKIEWVYEILRDNNLNPNLFNTETTSPHNPQFI